MQITFGVEEEFFLVDPATGALVAGAAEVLPAARDRLGEAVTTELNLCQIETDTPVCTTIDELGAALQRLRHGLSAVAAGAGLAVVPLATHPFSDWQDQSVDVANPRYAVMEERYEVLARQQIICGCHVHLGLGNRDLEIVVLDRVRPWLPVLLALSANSPFWVGQDTGYASYRTPVWSRWPTAGFPPELTSRDDYDRLVKAMVGAGAIPDATQLYWYARPSVRFPTLEIRVCDVCLAVDDCLAVAGLARGLAWSFATDHAPPAPQPAAAIRPVLDAALWRAARFGLSGELVHPLTGRPEPAPAVVDALLEAARPGLEAHDDWAVVSDLVGRVVAGGNGADRQRAAHARGGRDAIIGEALRSMASPMSA